MDVNPSFTLLAFLIALIVAGQARPSTVELLGFNIPAGPAASTLQEFAVQSNLNVLFQSDAVGTQPTRAVMGTFSPGEALIIMLAGSGLRHQFVERDSVLVSADSETGRCGLSGLEPCETKLSEGGESAVTVTGTSIHAGFDSGHVTHVGQYITLTRQYFATGGFRTVGDVLRSLPQGFGGGLNVGVLFAGGSQNITPISAASTVNLRGLGSDSTMLLVNGQRISASEGSNAVDVTLIPLSAVERIEITTGSASARYGSDAVAGVVNVVLRTDFQGLEVSSTLGYATEGGGFMHRYSVVGGHAINNANMFATADCAWQREIEAQQRSYSPTDIGGTTLMPGMQHCSTVFSANGFFLESALEAGIVGAYTKRFAYQAQSLTLLPATTLLESTTTLTASTRSDVAQYAVNPMLKWHFGNRWTATFLGGLSVNDLTSPERFTQSGVPDQYMGDRFDNRLWTGQLIASGPFARTRAGAAELAVGVGYNQQGFVFATLPGGAFNVSRQRHIRFAFAESTIPLLLSRSGSRGPPALSLEIGARRDHYSEVGVTTNAKIDLTYRPTPSVKLSATWGTSYRAPSLLQQFGASQALLEFVPDRTSATGQSLALLRFGGNALLMPEKSNDTVLDFTFTPEAIPDASLQVSYYNIFYRHRIEYPTQNTTDPLSDGNIGPFVIRNPSPAAVYQVLAQSQLTNFTGGQFTPESASLVIDDRNQNFARQKASGIDLLSKYGSDSLFGRLDATVNVAYLDLQQQIKNGGETGRLSGTVFYPPAFRGRFGISWSDRGYLGSLFVNYTGGSREVSPPDQRPDQTPKPIAPWTTLDGQLGVIFDGGAYSGRTKLTLSVQNLLDRHPPKIGASRPGPIWVNYDSTNTSALGRFLTLDVTTAW